MAKRKRTSTEKADYTYTGVLSRRIQYQYRFLDDDAKAASLRQVLPQILHIDKPEFEQRWRKLTGRGRAQLVALASEALDPHHEAEIEQKLPALLANLGYTQPIDEIDWRGAFVSLAKRHVPGFKFSCAPGRPRDSEDGFRKGLAVELKLLEAELKLLEKSANQKSLGKAAKPNISNAAMYAPKEFSNLKGKTSLDAMRSAHRGFRKTEFYRVFFEPMKAKDPVGAMIFGLRYLGK